MGSAGESPKVAAGWPACARLIGQGARARSLAVGVDAVRTAAQRDRVALAIVAKDASRNSREKLEPLLKARGVTLIVGPDSLRLGESVGRGAVAALGVLDANLAAGIVRLHGEQAATSEDV